MKFTSNSIITFVIIVFQLIFYKHWTPNFLKSTLNVYNLGIDLYKRRLKKWIGEI